MRAKIISLLLLTALIIVSINFLIHLSSNDLITIVGLIFGGTGLFFTFWQTWMSFDSSRDAKLNNVVDQLKCEMRNMVECSEKRDFIHDQQIIKLTAEIKSISSQLEFHSRFLANEVSLLKNESSEHRASIAGLTRFGELNQKMNKFERRMDQLIRLSLTTNPVIEGEVNG